MIRRIIGLWRKPKSINVKVLLLISILILPLNTIAILVSNKVVENTEVQAMNSEQAVINLYMTDLKTTMSESSNLLFYFNSSDPNCLEMKQQRDDDYIYGSAKLKFFATLKQMDAITEAADGYFYYMLTKDDDIVYGPAAETRAVREILLNDIDIKNKKNNGTTVGWHIYEGDDTEYLIYVFRESNFVYGAWINLDKKKAEIREEIEYTYVNLMFAENKSLPNNAGKIHLYATEKNIYLSLYLERNEILEGVDFYLKFFKGFTLVYLVLIPVLYFFLKWLLLNPLRLIGAAHREIENGNYDYHIVESHESIEYKRVFKSFNQMVDQLHQYKTEVYEKELERQKMELRNLQLQIRPHFLLNTFNLVFTLTQQGNTESIQLIILYLSDYFRYIFRNERELSHFSKEIELIRGYIRVLSIRYQGQIMLDEDIDPEVLFVRTPPLMIHNFIENAVKYGKKEGQVLHISLRAEYEKGWVTMLILDDGNGFDDGSLQSSKELFSGEKEPVNKNAHLGLYNSYKRLKYFYGDDASLEVESEQGVMTLFTIRFKYDLEVDDELIDYQ